MDRNGNMAIRRSPGDPLYGRKLRHFAKTDLISQSERSGFDAALLGAQAAITIMFWRVAARRNLFLIRRPSLRWETQHHGGCPALD